MLGINKYKIKQSKFFRIRCRQTNVPNGSNIFKIPFYRMLLHKDTLKIVLLPATDGKEM